MEKMRTEQFLRNILSLILGVVQRINRRRWYFRFIAPFNLAVIIYLLCFIIPFMALFELFGGWD